METRMARCADHSVLIALVTIPVAAAVPTFKQPGYTLRRNSQRRSNRTRMRSPRNANDADAYRWLGVAYFICTDSTVWLRALRWRLRDEGVESLERSVQLSPEPAVDADPRGGVHDHGQFGQVQRLDRSSIGLATPLPPK